MIPHCPVVFGASVSLSSTQPSGPVDDIKAVRASFQTPILVDEISVHMPISLDGLTQPPDLLELDLRVGACPITRGFVNVSLIGRQENLAVTNLGWVWKFARPMIIGAGAQILPSFRLTGGDGNRIYFVVRGRALPRNYELPAVSHVPYLTAWENTFSGGAQGTAVVARSTAPYLTNDHNVPLHCQRLVGTINGGPWTGRVDPRKANVGANPVDGTCDLNVQLFHSSGQGIVKDPTPFWHLFGFPDNAWNNPFDLLPRESIYARVRTTGPSSALTARIGIQGYRAVPISEVM